MIIHGVIPLRIELPSDVGYLGLHPHQDATLQGVLAPVFPHDLERHLLGLDFISSNAAFHGVALPRYPEEIPLGTCDTLQFLLFTRGCLVVTLRHVRRIAKTLYTGSDDDGTRLCISASERP